MEQITPETKRTKNIHDVELFVGFLDRSTLESAKCHVQMLIAKDKGVPMFYVVPKGVELPFVYTEGVKHLRIKVLDQYFEEFPNMEEPLEAVKEDIDAFVKELEQEGAF